MGTYNHAKNSIFQDRITVKTWSKHLTIFVMAPTRVPQFNTKFSRVVAGHHEQIMYAKLKFIKQSFYLILKFTWQHIRRTLFLSYYF